MKKYCLVKKTKRDVSGAVLYRIKALKNFRDVKKGDLGGWIAGEENLSQEGTAWIYNEAKVGDKAKVYGNAWVGGEVFVGDEVEIYGNARVRGDVLLYGKAKVFGEAKVYDRAHVWGEARVFGEAKVCGEAMLWDKAKATSPVINILGLKLNITICDNSVQVGCRFCYKKDINKLTYAQVEEEGFMLPDFKHLKRIIKTIIK